MVSPYLDQALDFDSIADRERWLATLREREPALGAEVAALLDEHLIAARDGYLEHGSPTLPATLSKVATLAGQTVGAYTLVSPIGHGGMGAVWLARRSDGRFERQVAIKFLSIALGLGSAARFTREGAIVGRLVHPHIAQLLDAGVSPGGQPYLILEFVDGSHIDRYCDDQALDRHARIRLFLEVLDAIACAHANLIVHRDLKPSNVLVRRDGRVKLLDFGIAKLIEDDGEPSPLTHEHGAALTPAYAAPEQITGAPITTATDVYSLGVLLYVLITGEHPAGESPTSAASMVTAIVETTPRRLPAGDLGTILGKSLKKVPAERYSSVSALADDLRRYLRHEPISARPDTLRYRTARFVRRHRIGVGITLAVLVSLSIALYAVNRQRAIAQRRFAEVRHLATTLFDIDVQVRRLAGSSTTRQFIVDSALDYLRQLAVDAGNDADLALDLGTAYLRVARVEGVPISPSLGQTDRADEHLRTAQAFIDRVLAAQPGNRLAILRAAQVAHDRMIISGQRERPDEALALGQLAAQRLEQYLQSGPVAPGEAEQVVITSMNVANRYMLAGREDEAIRMSRKTIEIANATNQPAQAASALTVVARAHVARGDLNAALDAAQEASRVLKEHAEREPAVNSTMTYILALTREASILGSADAPSLGRGKEATLLLQQAVDLSNAIVERDRTDSLSRQRFSLAAIDLASILRDHQPERALDLYERVIQLAGDPKDNVALRTYQLEALAGSSGVLRQLHRSIDAGLRLDEAMSIMAGAKLYPATRMAGGVDKVLAALAEHEATRGNRSHAIELYQQLLNDRLASRPKPETDLNDANGLSRLYTGLATVERDAGRSDEAAALAARRVKIWETWAMYRPGNPFVVRQLAAAQAAVH